jgi:HK97 family phage prohead protease
MTVPDITGTWYRTMRIDVRALDTEARTVPAALSSESIVQRLFGRERLSHAAGSINLERAADGLPLLWSHDPDQPLGRVRDVRLERDGRLRGVLHFARNPRAEEVWRDVRDGFLTDVSIGYRIDAWRESKAEPDLITATEWTVLEASIVTVPADPSVGINRGYSMDTQDMTPSAPDLTVIRNEATDAGIRQERARCAEIRALFATPGLSVHRAMQDTALAEGWTIDHTRAQLLTAMAAQSIPIGGRPAPEHEHRAGGFASQGATELERYRIGALRALAIRAGLERDKAVIDAEASSEFRGLTLVELAREYCRRANIDTRGLNKVQLAGLALTRGSGMITHSTSDFANVLVDAANKSLILGYTEAPETWQIWCEPVNLSDFKPSSRIALSTFGDLDVVPELGEYKYGTFSDSRETLTLRTYGKLFGISRQAIINDDVEAFTKIPMHMGRAAARMVGDEVYAITSGAGPTMSDGGALFNSTAITTAGGHANLITAGAAPSVTTLGVGFTRMAVVTDVAGGNVLNIKPRYLIVSASLEASARVLVAAQYDPAATLGTMTPNPYQGRLTVVADPRLDAIASGAPWFLASDPRMFPTIQVGFLDGQQSPYLEQQEGFTQDGVIFKVRLDCIAGAVAWQGLFQNDGA